MKKPRIPLGWYRNVRLRGKLLSLVMFLVLLAAVTGAAGLFFVTEIDRSVSVVAGVSSPMVRETATLVKEMDRAYVGLMEVLTTGVSSGDIDARLAEFRDSAEQAVARLRDLGARGALELELEGLVAGQVEFVQRARAMLDATRTQAERRGSVERRIAEFEDLRKDLDTRLAGLAKRAEGMMSQREDGAKTLAQSGAATVDQLHRILSETFTELFPVVRGSYAMLSYLMEAQDIARAYAAETHQAQLADLEKGFKTTVKKAATRLRKIRPKLEGSQDKADAEYIAKGLKRLSVVALTEDGLLPAHRQLLEATAAAERGRASLAAISGEHEAALRQIAATAERIDREAQDAVTLATRQAKWSIGVIVASGSILGLLLGDDAGRQIGVDGWSGHCSGRS